MPSITIQDLNNAKTDVDHIAAIATSTAPTATDRLGHTKLTIQGVLDGLQIINNNRGDWATGVTYAGRDLFTRDGVAYLVTAPYVSGDFDTDVVAGKFILFQGVPNIGPALAAAVPGEPIKNFANATFIFDGESTNSPAAGGVGWVEVVMGMSSFAGRGGAHYVAVPGRNMADTFAAYATNVRPLIQAAVAAGRAAFVFIQSGLNDYGLRPATAWFTPFDQYVSAVAADGGILVPMLCTRRQDWATSDGTRQSINAHILELGNPLTVPTDRIFTDPSFTGGSGFVAQSDDGIHPNAGTYALIAMAVNEVMEAQSGFAHVPQVSQKRALSNSQLPYVNALGQLSTDGNFLLELSTDARKNFILTLLNSFSEAGKTALRLQIPGDFKSWEIATVGDSSDFDPKLNLSLVIFDLQSNQPLISFSVYQQASTLYGQYDICRGGISSPRERLSSQVAYPTANNTPGSVGQWAVKPDKSKVAFYAGDGVSSHSWAVSPTSSAV